MPLLRTSLPPFVPLPRRGCVSSRALLRTIPLRCSNVCRNALADSPPKPDLTLRQQQLVTLVAKGLTNKEIASRLNLSEFTVRTSHPQHPETVNASSRSERCGNHPRLRLLDQFMTAYLPSIRTRLAMISRVYMLIPESNLRFRVADCNCFHTDVGASPFAYYVLSLYCVIAPISAVCATSVWKQLQSATRTQI